MTTMGFVAGLLLILIFFSWAVHILSDIISRRRQENKIFSCLTSIAICACSSYGVGIYVEKLYTMFSNYRFGLVIIATFGMYLIASTIIAIIKYEIDETKKLKEMETMTME